jgi:hypothetical protein
MRSSMLPYPCPCKHCGKQCTEADRRNHPRECRECVEHFAFVAYEWRNGAYDPWMDLQAIEDWRNIN